MDTERTQIHTPQHHNPHPTGGNLPPWNLMIPGAKLIPPLTLQTDTTLVMKVMTPNQAVQMNPEDPATLTDQEDQVALVDLEDLEAPTVLEIWADMATTLPTSKTSCGNS